MKTTIHSLMKRWRNVRATRAAGRRRRGRISRQAPVAFATEFMEARSLLTGGLDFDLSGNFEAFDESQYGQDSAFLGFGYEGALSDAPTSSAGDPQADPKFFGFEFDTGDIQKTAIAEDPFFGTKWGGEFRADLSGKLGVEVGAYVNTGSIDVDYEGSGSLQIPEVTALGSLPINSSFSFDSAEFSTQPIYPGLFVDIVAEVDGGIGATACVGGCIDVDIPLDVDFEQELIAFNRNNDRDLRLAGISVGEQAPGSGELTFDSKSGQQAGDAGGSGGSGVSTGFYVDFGPDDSELLGGEVSFGVGLGAKNILDLRREAGSLTITVPDYSLTDSSPAANGVLTANTVDLDRLEDGTHPTQLARLDLDLPTLASFPVSGEFGLSVGPAELTGQLFSYILEARLGLDQDVKVVPEYYINLDLSSPASVSIDGAPYALRDTIRVLPGTDVDILYSGEPIIVTPSFNFDVRVDNTLDLGVDLGGYLEMLALGFDVAGKEIFDLGPLLGRDETGSTFIENEPVARLFGGSFRLDNESVLTDFNRVGAPYTIGGSFTFDGDSAANPVFGTLAAGGASNYSHTVSQGEARPVTKRVALASGGGYQSGDLVSTGREGETQLSSDLPAGGVATAVASETRLLEPGSANSPGGLNAPVTLAAYRDPTGERQTGHPDVNRDDPNLTDSYLNPYGYVTRGSAENRLADWVAYNFAREQAGLPGRPVSSLDMGGWMPSNFLFDQVNQLIADGNTIHTYQSVEYFQFENPYESDFFFDYTHTIPRVNYIDHINDPRPPGQGASRSAHAWFWSGRGIDLEQTEAFSRQSVFGAGVEYSDVLERTTGPLQSPWLGYRNEYANVTNSYLGSRANAVDDLVIRYFDAGQAPTTTSETLGSVGPGLDKSIWAAADLIGSEVATEILFEATAGQFESLTFPTFSSSPTPAIAVRDRGVIYGVSEQAATLLNTANFDVEAFVDGTWSSVQTVSAGETLILGAGLYSDTGADRLRVVINNPTGSATAEDIAVSMQQLIVGLTFADTGVRYFSQGDVRFDGAFTATPVTLQTAEIAAPPEAADLLSADNQALEVDTFGASLPVFDENGRPTGVLASEALNIIFDVNSSLADFADAVETGFERYSVDVPLTIPDGGTVTSSLVIDNNFEISDLDVRLNVLHERIGDLTVSLVSPNGTRVQLVSQVGGDGDNFVQTKFDDEAIRNDGAPRHIGEAAAAAPYSGRFVPAESLSAFDGENTRGTWLLEVSDQQSGIEGTLTRWSILPKVRRIANPQQIVELRDTAAAGSDVQGTNVAEPTAVPGSSAANPIAPADPAADPLELLLTSWDTPVDVTDLILDGEVIASTAAGTPDRPLSDLFLPGGLLDGLIDPSDPDAAVNAIQQLQNEGRLSQVTRNGRIGVTDFLFVQVPDAAGYEYTAPAGTQITEFAIDGDFGSSPLLGDTWDLFIPDGLGGFRFFRTVNCLHSVTLPDGGVNAVRLYSRSLPETVGQNSLNNAAMELNIVAGFKLSGSPAATPPVMNAASLGPRVASIDSVDITTGDDANDGVADDIRLIRNGAVVDVYVNGTLVESIATTSVNTVNIIGSEDDDVLISDLSGGALGVSVNFSGGPGTNVDQIVVTGDSPREFTHDFTNELSGSLRIDAATVSYRRVELIVDDTASYAVSEGDSVPLNHVKYAAGDADSPIRMQIDYAVGGSGFTADATGDHFEANGLDGPSTVVAAVRMQAEDGTVSIPVLSTINVLNAAPAVDAGSDITITENNTVSLEAVAGSRGRPATFNDAGTPDIHEATVNWGDGTPTMAAGVIESPLSGQPGIAGGLIGQLTGSHTFADDGVYTVTVSVRDDDMPAGEWITDSFDVTVLNSVPQLNAGPDRIVAEGEFLSLSPATFADAGFDFDPAGTSEDFEAFIDWGDGTTEPIADIHLTDNADGTPGVPTTGTITASHAFADNGTYTVTVNVRDDDMPVGEWVSDTFDVVVSSVAPNIDHETLQNSAPSFGGAGENDPVTVSVEFTDAGFDNPAGGTTEDFTASTIDWGDGTVSAVPDITVDEVSGSEGTVTTGTISGTHTYAHGGVYRVTLTAEDDDGQSDSTTTTVQITGVGIVDRVLYVVGTDRTDVAKLWISGWHNTISVYAHLDRHGWFGHRGQRFFRTYSLDDIDQVVTLLGDSSDTVTMRDGYRRGSVVSLPMTVVAGAGNDFIVTGNADANIDAGDGDDTIITGRGHDTIDAGDGNNVVNAGDGSDVVTTGSGHDRVFAYDGDNRISTGPGDDRVWTGRGNDRIDAGAGNDTVRSNAGNDVVLGRAGDDFIDTGADNDIAIGGTGRDIIFGSHGEDLLIAGSLNASDNEIDDLFADWNSATDFPDRTESLRIGSGAFGDPLLSRVTDDDAPDYLSGGSGRDWLLAITGPNRDRIRRRHDDLFDQIPN